MMKQHSWASIAHNFPDPFPHFWLIAVHPAVRAERFAFHKRTLITSCSDIVGQFLALPAQMTFAVP